MKLKMNRNRVRTNVKSKSSLMMTKSLSLPVSEIKVKEEKSTLSDEEFIHVESISPGIVKVEVNEVCIAFNIITFYLSKELSIRMFEFFRILKSYFKN